MRLRINGRKHWPWRAVDREGIVLDVLVMLVTQGVIGIRLWAGRDPRPAVMRQALEQALAS